MLDEIYLNGVVKDVISVWRGSVNIDREIENFDGSVVEFGCDNQPLNAIKIYKGLLDSNNIDRISKELVMDVNPIQLSRGIDAVSRENSN